MQSKYTASREGTVIVNDLGEISIDSQLVIDADKAKRRVSPSRSFPHPSSRSAAVVSDVASKQFGRLKKGALVDDTTESSRC